MRSLARLPCVLRRPLSALKVKELRMATAWSIVSVRESAATKLNTITYLDGDKKERLWDSCERTTRQEGSSADAVVIFALLRSRGAPPATLLVRQFRPPIGCDTLELPAGLIDPGESAAEAALRELKEETGFTATLRSVSPAACMSPGLTSETVHFVTVDVDLDAPANAGTPEQSEEDAGSVFVSRVPLAGLGAALEAHTQRGGVVFAGLYALATGLSVAAA